MLNFQSAQNATKTVPLRLSRLPDSDGIFTFSNGVRMEKISQSVRRAKQGKFWMLTVPVHTVRTGHVAGLYRTHGRNIQHTWLFRTGHVAAPGRDTCQAFMDFWAYG